MKRREIIKGLTLIPFAGGLAASPLNTMASAVTGDKQSLIEGLEAIEEDLVKHGESILKSINVGPFVNCKGTNTIMGGSVVRPEVRLAMEAVSTLNVHMDELAFGVGKRLAELTGAEWGLVTSGCSAGIKLVTAACLTGGDPEKLIRIPDLTGFSRNEVIIPKSSRTVYDHAIRSSGAKVIMVETIEDLKRNISPRTAMIYMMAENLSEPLTIENVSKVARPMNVPVFIDSAANILTIPNVHLEQGADVVAFSGGKGLKAPGCSGLLLGRKDLLISAWQASAPHHGFGRDNKVGREECIGMLAAVETWAKMDHVKEMNTWVSWLENIQKHVSGINGVQTSITKPDPQLLHHVTPYLYITWDPLKLHVTGQEIADELFSSEPRVGVQTGRDEPGITGITLVGYMMIPGNDKVAGERIFEVLSRKRSQKVETAMKTPGSNLVGQWDLEVEYFNSKAVQQLFIDKQEGNWLTGVYKTDFSMRTISGSIDGNDLKLESHYNVPGDSITSIFHGAINGDTIAGKIDLGEFLAAKFTAKRHVYPLNKKQIVVPKGRPQSS